MRARTSQVTVGRGVRVGGGDAAWSSSRCLRAASSSSVACSERYVSEDVFVVGMWNESSEPPGVRGGVNEGEISGGTE